MSAPRTIIDLRARLDEALALARQDARESKSVAPNSYGHGYDDGFLDALIKISNTINDVGDNTI